MRGKSVPLTHTSFRIFLTVDQIASLYSYDLTVSGEYRHKEELLQLHRTRIAEKRLLNRARSFADANLTAELSEADAILQQMEQDLQVTHGQWQKLIAEKISSEGTQSRISIILSRNVNYDGDVEIAKEEGKESW